MRLSVILPCFNGAETIEVQLKALTQQQWSDGWEVIVSNNGSTDESMAIVERYRDRLPNLRIANAYTPPGPRLGVPHSYNVGIKAATGDAFVFCEADDEVAPGWLEAMGRALTQHAFVACRLEYHKLNEPWRVEGSDKGVESSGLLEFDFPPYLPCASGCRFGFRRSLYEAIGELNPAFPSSHDSEYSWRAQYAGFKIHVVPDAVMHYRLRHGFAALYKQGRNWGQDFMLVRKYYRSPVGRLDPVRALLQLLIALPNGIWLGLQLQQQRPQSRRKFADWLWDMGYSVGTFQGLLKQPPAPQKGVSNAAWCNELPSFTNS
jgi:glycosyltransferase involved in cell wall biosynthesis